jgi:hypothetical protein
MNWDLITGSLLSIPVLMFLLGLIAASLKADLRLPDAIYQAITIYLLLAIGMKGGIALRDATIQEAFGPVLLAMALGVVIPLAAFGALRVLTPLGPVDRGAMAAHYGSTSLVTFTAAIVFLETIAIPFEGFTVTLLAILEVPGIVVGLVLARRYSNRAEPLAPVIREVVTSKSILLLIGGLAIGWLAGNSGYERVAPLFDGLFTGLLALFLLEMGVLTGRRLGDLRIVGPGLIVFAIVFPIAAGAVSLTAALLIGMSPGGAMLLGVLGASASYIAAPAAVRLALPGANPAITIMASLGITFPFNLIIGIPLYWWMTEQLSGVLP